MPSPGETGARDPSRGVGAARIVLGYFGSQFAIEAHVDAAGVVRVHRTGFVAGAERRHGRWFGWTGQAHTFQLEGATLRALVRDVEALGRGGAALPDEGKIRTAISHAIVIRHDDGEPAFEHAVAYDPEQGRYFPLLGDDLDRRMFAVWEAHVMALIPSDAERATRAPRCTVRAAQRSALGTRECVVHEDGTYTLVSRSSRGATTTTGALALDPDVHRELLREVTGLLGAPSRPDSGEAVPSGQRMAVLAVSSGDCHVEHATRLHQTHGRWRPVDPTPEDDDVLEVWEWLWRRLFLGPAGG